jgi:nicotinate-nucleotide pyrophosphorylase (carboxylating)
MFDTVSFIKSALTEDLGTGDHTTLATIPRESEGEARLLVKEKGVLSGSQLALEILHFIDPSLNCQFFLHDSQSVSPGDEAFRVKGKIHSILVAERLLLNCMQRMSGVATATKAFVDAIAGTKAQILDTRKTTPMMRALEKKAVLDGGGSNHRFGLYDMILIKDNHIDACGKDIRKALEKAADYNNRLSSRLRIEVETRSMIDVENALKTGIPDRIMFDNFSPELTEQAVKLVDGRVETESSGGIQLKNVRAFAETGVDFISVGALTHSVKSLDLSLKIIP